jgi:cyclohexanone monooxygenase
MKLNNGAGMTEILSGSSNVTEIDAVVIGAGFGGLRMLYELRKLNVQAVALEAATDVGGTWHWNRYPGARTDSESWVYCFSFSEELQQEWNWKDRYPSQPEMKAYLSHVADRFDLRRDIRFQTRVSSARYDDATGLWSIETEAGERFVCRYFIPATGPISKPIMPTFPGLDSFAGETYLTARWPDHPVSFAGKRVAVIGTGSTGIQVVPEVAKDASQVIVFQRTANFALPGRNRALTDEERQAIKDRYPEIWAQTQRQISGFAIPETREMFGDLSEAERQERLSSAYERGGFEFLFTAFRDMLVQEEANEAAAEFLRAHIRRTVKDPETAELLCPKGYPFGARRPAVEHGYFEAFNRPNVKLVDISRDPIKKITPTGLQTDNASYEFDMLIFATGFDAGAGAMLAMDITGRKGVSLSEKWSDGPRTYLGIMVDEFPNRFMVSGPQTPFGNIPVMIENEVRWIGAAIAYCERVAAVSLEPAPEMVDGWVDEVWANLNATLLREAGSAGSWYLGLNVEGRPPAPVFFHGKASKYFSRLEEIVQAEFADFSCLTMGAAA